LLLHVFSCISSVPYTGLPFIYEEKMKAGTQSKKHLKNRRKVAMHFQFGYYPILKINSRLYEISVSHTLHGVDGGNSFSSSCNMVVAGR
jgi:hypothetical protein